MMGEPRFSLCGSESLTNDPPPTVIHLFLSCKHHASLRQAGSRAERSAGRLILPLGDVELEHIHFMDMLQRFGSSPIWPASTRG